MKYAEDIVKEMNERGEITIPEGYFASDAYDEHIQGCPNKIMNVKLEQKGYIMDKTLIHTKHFSLYFSTLQIGFAVLVVPDHKSLHINLLVLEIVLSA